MDLLDNLREELKHVREGVEGAFTSQNARDCSQRTTKRFRSDPTVEQNPGSTDSTSRDDIGLESSNFYY